MQVRVRHSQILMDPIKAQFPVSLLEGERVPLVVALHFATGSGAAMEQNTGLSDEAMCSGERRHK